MKATNFPNTLSATLVIGGLILSTSALAQSRGGNGSDMMGGYGFGWMGGYGGILLPVLLVVVIAGLVVWAQKKK